MAHQVHPKSFRLKEASDWQSRWLSRKKLPQYLEEDFKIREFLKKKLKDCSIENVEIERFPGKVSVILNTARPGLIIGRGGRGVEELKKALERVLGKPASVRPGRTPADKEELKVEIKEIRNPWLSASLVAQWVAQQIEKRVPHRRILKQAIEKVMFNKESKGVRIEVSGRLNGVEIARREWLKKGRLPRQTLRAVIDYAQAEALCTYGVIGIKVWIYKGERF
jgi:small subunit ribosomal protein S3